MPQRISSSTIFYTLLPPLGYGGRAFILWDGTDPDLLEIHDIAERLCLMKEHDKTITIGNLVYRGYEFSTTRRCWESVGTEPPWNEIRRRLYSLFGESGTLEGARATASCIYHSNWRFKPYKPKPKSFTLKVYLLRRWKKLRKLISRF